MNNLDIENRSDVEKIIAGALKSTINVHGPITPEWIGSASKRIYGQLRGLAKLQRKEQDNGCSE